MKAEVGVDEQDSCGARLAVDEVDSDGVSVARVDVQAARLQAREFVMALVREPFGDESERWRVDGVNRLFRVRDFRFRQRRVHVNVGGAGDEGEREQGEGEVSAHEGEHSMPVLGVTCEIKSTRSGS